MCCWDHLGWMHDWLNPVKHSVQTLRVCGWCRDLLVLQSPRLALYITSLAYWTCPLPIWTVLPLALISFALHVQGQVLYLTHPPGEFLNLWSNNWRNSQNTGGREGSILGKEKYAGEIPSWPSTAVWEGMAQKHQLLWCFCLRIYGIVHWGKEKRVAAAADGL